MEYRERAQLWAAYGLLDDYVKLTITYQLGHTVEMSPCVPHDVLLPPGHVILRPSLESEHGVGIFWGDILLNLRRFYAPHGTIDDLVRRLDKISREGNILPRAYELYAREEDLGLAKYEGDGKEHMIMARRKRDAT